MSDQQDRDLVLRDPQEGLVQNDGPTLTVLAWIMTADTDSMSLEEQIKFSAVLKFLQTQAEVARKSVTASLKARFERNDFGGLVPQESETGKSTSIPIDGLRVQYMKPSISDKVNRKKLEALFEEKGLPVDEIVEKVTLVTKGKKARASLDEVRALEALGAKATYDYNAALLKTMADVGILTEEEVHGVMEQSMAGSRVICTLKKEAAEVVEDRIRLNAVMQGGTRVNKISE